MSWWDVQGEATLTCGECGTSSNALVGCKFSNGATEKLCINCLVEAKRNGDRFEVL